MWRNLFRKRGRVVEVVGTSGSKKVLSHDEYISATIAEQRAQAELFRMGISVRRDPEYLLEHVMRRRML